MGNKTLQLNMGSFNLMKGWGMLHVILIHMSSYYNPEQSAALQTLLFWLKMVSAGLVPMFLIISGFGFRECSPKKLLRECWKGFLVPYLWVMAGYAVLYPIVMVALYKSWPNAVYETLRFVLAFLLGLSKEGFVVLGISLRFCSAAWFFLASFVAMQVLNLILKVKKLRLQALLALLCPVVGYLLMQLNFFYFCIPQGLITAAFCYVGYCISRYKLLGRMLRSIPLLSVLLAVAVLEGLFGYCDIASGTMKLFLLDLPAACCTGVLFFLAGIRFSLRENRAGGLFRQIGLYSYWILAIHSVEMMGIPWILWAQKFPEHQALAYLLELLFRGLIIAAVCLILKQLFRSRHRKFLKKRQRYQPQQEGTI